MITVVIPTLESERLLVPTLAALVPGSAEGLVREVLLVDGGSRDDTAKIADAAGCEFLRGPVDEAARLAAGARAARSDWLLFIAPGGVLEDGWTREVGAFVARAGEGNERAATFRLAVEGYGLAPRLKELGAAARLALTRRPRADQGLLVAKQSYLSNGGRIGGVVALRTRIVIPV